MQLNSEFRCPQKMTELSRAMYQVVKHPWTLMEVCGGQTHAISRYGIMDQLPPTVEIIHGPGCPVCVTPIDIIDQAIALSKEPNVVLCSFGDMLRVPGTHESLLTAKSMGGCLRLVYSPMDALKYAQQNPKKEVVFFGVGFETTAPAIAMAIYQAWKLKLSNFSVLCTHVLVPPALEYILQNEDNRVQGFLAAGHVCTVMGIQQYESIAAHYHTPIVVTGFEPVDIMQGILSNLIMLEEGRAAVDNQYARYVKPQGNPHAQGLVNEIFETIDFPWRGLGTIAQSGLKIRDYYQAFDASCKLDYAEPFEATQCSCISGLILTGQKKPFQCPSFNKTCTPENPLGAPMVSSEGACAAYFQYHRDKELA